MSAGERRQAEVDLETFAFQIVLGKRMETRMEVRSGTD